MLGNVTPVEATLIATSVTATVSTAAVIITHRLTQGRDRRHRVWDRRMDVYAEVMRVQQAFARSRKNILRDKDLSAEPLDPSYEAKAFGLMEARLAMFGSSTIVKLNEEAFQAFKAWVVALFEWKALSSVPNPDHPTIQREAEAKWAIVEKLFTEAEATHAAMVDAIKAEAEFKKTERTGLARLAIWRD